MKRFQTLISRYIKTEKPILGRWRLESCDVKLSDKVQLSNEDHCGPCGQTLLIKPLNVVESSIKK
jgi:hypothetical protein